jgi:hypothetical protein
MAAGLSVQGRAYVTGHDTGLFVVAGGVAWPDVLGGPAERYIHGRGGPAERMTLHRADDLAAVVVTGAEERRGTERAD